MKSKYLPRTLEGKLGHLAEECNELAGIINKTLRFKAESGEYAEDALQYFNPELEAAPTNKELIKLEISDVLAAISALSRDCEFG